MSVKYTIRMSKDEAQAYQNFKKMVKPPEIADSDFDKLVFLRGIEYINLAIKEELDRIKTQDPEKFAEMTNPPQPSNDVSTL